MMLNDPRSKARSFLESTPIVSQLEEALNGLIYEKPEDLHGYLANYFLDHSKPPKVATMMLRRLIGPMTEPSVHIDLTISLRNKTEQHQGLTVLLSSANLSNLFVKQMEALINSSTLRASLNRLDLYNHAEIDRALENFRSNHSLKMAELAASEIEAANLEAAASAESTTSSGASKTQAQKRSTASAAGGKAAAAPSKKGANKDLPSIEILADDPEPTTFAGHLLISGLSLSCRLISAEMQQTQLYRLICSSSLSQLTMPLPIIPVLQSGPSYPGKQSLVKYFMLIPSVKMVHNEEWIHKLHNIVQFIRDSLSNAKGATIQATFSTNDGCLVLPMDKAEQGLDLLQTAIQSVCGNEQHWFDIALQMAPYDVFDYTRGKYEVSTGLVKSPDELVDVYNEWLDAYPRCIMLIDPFRYADKPSVGRLCDRVSNRCYVTSTDLRRYQEVNDEEDINTMNCHFLTFDSAPTISEMIERTKKIQQNENFALGFFERDHQEVTENYAADLAVALGCRYIKLSGILSNGSHRNSSILQRLAAIRDDLEMNGVNRFAWPKENEFVQIHSTIENNEVERVPSPVNNAKGKDKKKRT